MFHQGFVRVAGLALAATLGAAAVAVAGPAAGRWDATLTLDGVAIPFRLDIVGEAGSLTGTLFNGDEPQTTTAAAVTDGQLELTFGHYLTRILATERDGRLEGVVEGRFGDGERYVSRHAFRAVRHVAPAPAEGAAPSIGGLWEIPHDTNKGEKAWRFIVRQDGASVSAAILRVDGDTGALTGRYVDGAFVLGHFDGSRPYLANIQPRGDGTLAIVLQGGFTPRTELTAYRPDVARARGFAAPADFSTHTTVRDPNEVFAFRFPDVDGREWSHEDAKIKGKVIVAVVTGTWCPNCHDEAQYLVQLYARCRDRGLEIVALDFEEPEQQGTLERVRAFTKKYGVGYTYLIAGAPIEMWEKVPQAVNLNTWPATLFVGRDGRVRNIHAGFAGPASGPYHDELKAEFTASIERLLDERGSTRAAAPGPGQH